MPPSRNWWGLYFYNMIVGDKRILLTPEAILQKISEYDIFRYYMPTKDWKLNKLTLSPFRNEKNPSFIIGNKKGYLTFMDFGDASKCGNCFIFVKLMFNLRSFHDVLMLIDRDFGLGIMSTENTGVYTAITKEYRQPESLGKRYCLIQVVTRKFTKEELAYWNRYHQSIDDLRENNVYSIKTLYLNKSRFPLKDTTLRFGYLYNGEHWKIYRPFGGKKEKWVPNNVPITTMDGERDIIGCKTAVINKSKKDYMVMKKIYPTCCGVQNEGIGCFSEENVNFIKGNSDKQILSFDSDDVGVRNSKVITEMFGFHYMNVPRKYLAEGIKDWSDLAAKYGMNEMSKILKSKSILVWD